MGKRNSVLLVMVITCSIFFGSCTKEGDGATAPGPAITPVIDGYLCTIGSYRSSTDTLVFDVVQHMSRGTAMVAYISKDNKPANQVGFIVQGSKDLFRIKLKQPYIGASGKLYTHFFIKPDPGSFPEYPHYFGVALEDNDVSELQFVIERSSNDNRKFTIESKKYPGNYLNIAKPKIIVSTGASRLVYTAVKREFFFMPN